MEKIVLPKYDDCEIAQRTAKADPLQQFIYWNQPAKRVSETWRMELQDAIDFVVTKTLVTLAEENKVADFPVVWRDDGVRFLRNEDGTYSMENSGMEPPYRYRLESLIRSGAFTVFATKSRGAEK